MKKRKRLYADIYDTKLHQISKTHPPNMLC